MSSQPSWTLLPANTFAGHAEQWDALNKRSANTLLLDSDFVEPLIKHFGTGQEKLAICGPADNPCAMAVVTKAGFGKWITFQPSQAPIGIWLQSPELSVDELCNSLRKALPGLTLVFSITQQDPQVLKRPENSNQTSTLDYIETASVPVEGSFDDYWSQRGKNLRQGLKRQRNRLKREEVATQMTCLSKPEDMIEAVTVYGNLESAGWKAKTNTAIHIDNDQGQFYSEMLSRFSQRGLAAVYQYFYNDALAATDLCIQDDQNIIILKTTYDESISTSSPTMLMRQEMFTEIFSRGATKRIEFYGKVMDWHLKWSNGIRRMYHVNTSAKSISLVKKMLSR